MLNFRLVVSICFSADENLYPDGSNPLAVEQENLRNDLLPDYIAMLIENDANKIEVKLELANRIKCDENNHQWDWADGDWVCRACGVSAAAVMLPLRKE